LLDAIDREVDARPASRVAAAAHALTEDYARGRPSPVDDEAWHAAYLATRLPATYAAVSATLAMLPDHVRARCRDVLDLGAGPGTATWAALAACEGVQAALQVDRSAALLGVGARLAPGALDGRAVAMSSRVADIGVATDWPAADLVISAPGAGRLGRHAAGARAGGARHAHRLHASGRGQDAPAGGRGPPRGAVPTRRPVPGAGGGRT
jgi:hypothetical protein